MSNLNESKYDFVLLIQIAKAIAKFR